MPDPDKPGQFGNNGVWTKPRLSRTRRDAEWEVSCQYCAPKRKELDVSGLRLILGAWDGCQNCRDGSAENLRHLSRLLSGSDGRIVRPRTRVSRATSSGLDWPVKRKPLETSRRPRASAMYDAKRNHAARNGDDGRQHGHAIVVGDFDGIRNRHTDDSRVWPAIVDDGSSAQSSNTPVAQPDSALHLGSGDPARRGPQKRGSTDSSGPTSAPSATVKTCSTQYHEPQLHFWRGSCSLSCMS